MKQLTLLGEKVRFHDPYYHLDGFCQQLPKKGWMELRPSIDSKTVLYKQDGSGRDGYVS